MLGLRTTLTGVPKPQGQVGAKDLSLAPAMPPNVFLLRNGTPLLLRNGTPYLLRSH